ncbi:MAG: hypothetical protein M0027_16425 [Candidatus Dormibacteraeota bacterium]|jgi:negative regulator of sigma E activity|nr:hypothetical protein [Candidatus Dormibacteraeota bacterium]
MSQGEPSWSELEPLAAEMAKVAARASVMAVAIWAGVAVKAEREREARVKPDAVLPPEEKG